jgi:hypothetical protein
MKVLKALGAIFGLIVLAQVLMVLLGSGAGGDTGILRAFIEEVVPFGNIIGAAMGFVRTSVLAEPVTLIKLLTDTAKLLLETIVNPIAKGFFFVFLFENRKKNGESPAGYAKRAAADFNNPEPAWDRLRRTFSLRGGLAAFLGAITGICAAAFLFDWGAAFLIERMGEIPLVVLLILMIAGLFLLAWLSPILRPDLRPHTGLLISRSRGLLFSLIKTVGVNIVIVLVVGCLSL